MLLRVAPLNPKGCGSQLWLQAQGKKNVTWLPGKPAQNTEIGLFAPKKREKRTMHTQT
jgi:hypothetical protein